MNTHTQYQALETYFDLMSMNGGARVYHIARGCGIFDALESGADSPRAVATHCGLKETPVRLLLDTLCGIDTVQCHDGSYSLTPVMSFLAGSYRDLSNEYWDHLPQFLASGEPLARMDDASESEEQYEKQVTALAWMMKPAAEAAAVMLGFGKTRSGQRILDVGAGSAVWSLTCAQKDPQSRVRAVDWPAVLRIAEAAAARDGLLDRFEGLPGNYHEVDLPPAAHDLVIVANVTHLETREGHAALFRKLHGTLAAAGEIVIIDVMPGQEKGDLARGLYALGLALRTERGRVHSCAELCDSLLEAGFVAPQVHPLPVCPHSMGMIIAGKEAPTC